MYNENKINKDDWSVRVEWVDTNVEKIISMDKEFILKAEKPLQFAAFCFEYKKYLKNKKPTLK